MAVTQYIGSRYVPLFADPIEWSSQNTYEPLTIVVHEGNSYTSKQAVPKDIAIDNEDFWALTGNYNAQIEQYRRETADAMDAAGAAQDSAEAAQADIDTLLPKSEFSVSNTVKNYVDESIDGAKEELRQDIAKVRDGFDVAWISDTTGTCVVCKGESGIICLDIGSRDGDPALFAGQLSDFLDGRKIDVIVISHYHDDHSTGYDVVKRFAADGCKVYEQMNPTTANTQYTQYVTNRQLIIDTFGADNVMVPIDGESFRVGDLSLKMVNTDPANISAYNAVNGENSRNENGLNVYSIISFVSKNGNTLCFTGDCEGITQRLNTKYAQPCTVLSTPHHGVNYLGYAEFFDRCNPKAFLYTKRNTQVYNTIPIATYSDRFTGRYGIANNVPFLNGGSQALFNLSAGSIFIDDEQAVLCSAADGTKGYAYSPIEMLGVTYYNDDPYSLITMTGEEFLNNCRNYNPKQSCTFTGAYQILAQVPQFVTDIITFLGATNTEAIRVTPFGSALFIGNPSSTNTTKMAVMAGSANLSDTSSTDGTETSVTITDNVIKAMLSNGCGNPYVEVAQTAGSNAFYRVYLKPINAANREYRGVTTDRGLTRLFSAVILDNVITAHCLTIASSTVTDCYIYGFGVGE